MLIRCTTRETHTSQEMPSSQPFCEQKCADGLEAYEATLASVRHNIPLIKHMESSTEMYLR